MRSKEQYNTAIDLSNGGLYDKLMEIQEATMAMNADTVDAVRFISEKVAMLDVEIELQKKALRALELQVRDQAVILEKMAVTLKEVAHGRG